MEHLEPLIDFSCRGSAKVYKPSRNLRLENQQETLLMCFGWYIIFQSHSFGYAAKRSRNHANMLDLARFFTAFVLR